MAWKVLCCQFESLWNRLIRVRIMRERISSSLFRKDAIVVMKMFEDNWFSMVIPNNSGSSRVGHSDKLSNELQHLVPELVRWEVWQAYQRCLWVLASCSVEHCRLLDCTRDIPVEFELSKCRSTSLGLFCTYRQSSRVIPRLPYSSFRNALTKPSQNILIDLTGNL